MQLLIKKLSPDAIIPTRASQGSVGYDLYSTEDTVVPCQCGRVIVGTGIAVGLPEGVYARIAPPIRARCETLYRCRCGCY